MPVLEWLNKNNTIKTTDKVPYRLLKENKEYSYGEKNSNMIIKGDNLEALKALLPYYKNQIKCIYIDPPYNTGNRFTIHGDKLAYDDNLEHSIWLDMMYPRIELLYELLSDKGLFWVSIDDREVHYLKVICDEIFGRTNFISDITYERSGSAGLGQGGLLVNTAEHILLYKKQQQETNDVLGSTPLELKTMKRYNKVLVNEGERELVDEFEAASNGEKVKVYRHNNFEITTISLKDYQNRAKEINEEFVNNFQKLFRTNNVQKENEFQNSLLAKMDKKFLYTVDYIPSRGKHKGELTTLYYYNAELFAWLKDTAYIEQDTIMKTNKLTTVWKHEDIPKADLANEGQVDFPRNKKPEQLLKRIIEMSTNENDIVLDSFAGSATTCAVAHKMKRRYIGIEFGEHAITLCVPRMKNVINGTDRTGVTKSVEWDKGGGYTFYTLGDPVFDENGNINTNIDYETMASHIWFSETKTPLVNHNKSPLLGIYNDTAYYLLFNGILGDNNENILTNKILENLPQYDGKKVIYGEATRISEEKLKKYDIEFKQIPYDVQAR